MFDLDGVRHVGPMGPPVGFPFLERDGQHSATSGLRLMRIDARTYQIRESGKPDATFTVPEGGTFAHLSLLSRPGGAQIAFRYGRDGTLDSVVDSLGQTLHFERDAAGNLTRINITPPGARKSDW